MKRAQDIGSEFEADCTVVFKQLLSKHRLYFDRIYDTKSARSFIPVRPGDFYVAHNEKTWILECKASARYETLRAGFSNLVEDEQIAEMRLWERTGNGCVYLFRSKLSMTIEAWDGRDIFTARLSGKPLPVNGCLKSVPYDQLYEIIYWLFIGQYE